MKNKKILMGVSLLLGIGVIISIIMIFIEVGKRVKEKREIKKAEEEKKLQAKAKRERELIRKGNAYIDAQLKTLAKPNEVLSKLNKSDISKSDLSILYDELDIAYSKLTHGNTEETNKKLVKQYENIVNSVSTKEDCEIFIEHLKRRNEKEATDRKMKHEAALEEMKYKSELDKAKLEYESKEKEAQRKYELDKEKIRLAKETAAKPFDTAVNIANILGKNKED